MEKLEPIAYLVGGFVIKEIFDYLKDRYKKNQDHIETSRDSTIDENTKAIVDLKIAITTLQVEIKHALEKLSMIPKMEKDINEAHSKIRMMERENGTP